MYQSLKSAATMQKSVDTMQKELDKIDLYAEKIKHEQLLKEICARHGVTDPSVSEIRYIRLDKTDYPYTGNVIKPRVIIITDDGKTLDSSNYTVKYPNNSIQIGKYSLTITYKGKENIKMRDGTKQDAYHIKFRFTQEGGKKSSDNLDAWMSTDAQRIPLLLVGKLPVGEVKCYYKN